VILTHAGHRRRITAAVAGLALSSSFMVAGAALAGPAPGSPPAWVRNTRSVPALPTGSRALRAVPVATAVHADVVLKPRDPAALDAFDTAVSTPGSPSFRRFLTPGAFAGTFGPLSTTISAVRQWLTGRGLVVGPTSADGLVVPVSGSVGQVDRAFDLGLEQYRLPSGRLVRAPDAGPLVPGPLSAVVSGVAGLDDVNRPVAQLVGSGARIGPAGTWPAPARAAAVESPRAGGPTPTPGCTTQINSNGANAGALTADDLAQAYSFSSLYPGTEGAGVSVGVYELEPYLTADINMFKNCYTPAIAAPVNAVSVDGAPPHAGPGAGEAALDVEMVIGMAPSATVSVYVGPNGGTGPLDTYLAMVDAPSPPQVISTSWGQCEAQLAPVDIQAEATLFEQAVSQGQTVTAASGDAGSEDCYVFPSSTDTRLAVDDPASQPWVTGVGGTTLDPGGPPPAETAWNSGLFAGTGGGGSSATWTMPTWQRGPGVQSPFTEAGDAFTGAQPCPVSAGPGTVSCREVPDVASDADPRTGFAMFCSCFTGGWEKIGGTSMSSPLWAALAALADESQPSPVGFINPVLYQSRCQAGPPLNDITVGNNQPLGSEPSDPPRTPSGPYYPATADYDLATGLGTPVADALVNRLRAPPPGTCPVVTGISASSGPAAGGTPVTVSGSNLSSVTEVDFGIGNPGALVSVTPTALTVLTPVSPTRGWDSSEVFVRAGNDVLGYDGSMPFTYVGPRGYWTVASDGGIFSFGQMGFYGSMGGKPLTQPIVGMAPTPSSQGYWLVASDGGIFAFGDAGFHGSAGNVRLTKPVVGMAATPDGGGYWLVASDGGIFTYGDAAFHGSAGNIRLTKPVAGMAATPDGGGYWLVASDGGIFAYDGRYGGFFGSAGDLRLTRPMVGIGAP
jgi:subtilase family serine protease